MTCSYGAYDGPCPSLRLSPFENKIGGYPDFLNKDCLLSSAPSCGSCHAPLVLLAQLYCPMEGSPYHRMLHIFCCTQQTCWSKSESWLVLRSQALAETTPPQQDRGECSLTSGMKTAAETWCDGAGDWGESDSDEEIDLEDRKISHVHKKLDALTLHHNGIETQNDLKLNAVLSEGKGPNGIESSVILGRSMEIESGAVFSENAMQNGMECSAMPSESEERNGVNTVVEMYEGPCYSSAYIRAVEEVETTASLATDANRLLRQYQLENPDLAREQSLAAPLGGRRSRGAKCEGGTEPTTTSEGGEKYEKATARHGDRTFLKFQKELSKCPHQIIRYCWNGVPVLISDQNQAQILQEKKSCASCGAECVFECQLMPALVYVLQTHLCPSHHKDLPQRGATNVPPSSHSRCHGNNYMLKAVEFGTVIIFSCSASCWEERNCNKFKREMVFCQSESSC